MQLFSWINISSVKSMLIFSWMDQSVFWIWSHVALFMDSHSTIWSQMHLLWTGRFFYIYSYNADNFLNVYSTNKNNNTWKYSNDYMVEFLLTIYDKYHLVLCMRHHIIKGFLSWNSQSRMKIWANPNNCISFCSQLFKICDASNREPLPTKLTSIWLGHFSPYEIYNHQHLMHIVIDSSSVNYLTYNK